MRIIGGDSMRFFTLYKFELKKILFMAFAAIFVMYFSSVSIFSSKFNYIFYDYLAFNSFNDVTLTNNISILNLIWVTMLAFLQFRAFDFKEKGSLPFNNKSLFLATILSGITIILIGVLFYYALAGYELFKYKNILNSMGTTLIGITTFKASFLAFNINILFIFIMMIAFYIFAIIFLLTFKNPIIAVIFFAGFNVFLYLIAYDTSSVFLNALSFLSWFNYDFDLTFIGTLHTIYGTFLFNPYYIFLAVICAISLVAMLYFIAVFFFIKTENTAKNIVAKYKLGTMIIFFTTTMGVFYFIYSAFTSNNPISTLMKIILLIFSIIIGCIVVYVTNYLEFKKGGK